MLSVTRKPFLLSITNKPFMLSVIILSVVAPMEQHVKRSYRWGSSVKVFCAIGFRMKLTL